MSRVQKNLFMNDVVKKPVNWIVIIVIVSTLIALISVFFSQSSSLPGFVAEPLEEKAEDPLDVRPTAAHVVGELGIVMEYPADWRQVTIRGDTSFLHENGSMIQLQIRDYYPQINTLTGNEIMWDVESAGGRFHDFVHMGNSSAVYSFHLDGVEHIHYLTWDRMAIIGLKIEVHEDFYDYYFGTFMHILDNFTWDKPQPIPEDYIMLYNEFGNFEFGVPASWGTAMTEDGVFLAVSPDTGVIMYVSVFQDPTSFDGVSQIEYSNLISHGRANFILREFFNDGRTIYAEAVYVANGRNFIFLQQLASNGAFHYSFTLETPADFTEEAKHAFSTAVSLFRFG